MTRMVSEDIESGWRNLHEGQDGEETEARLDRMVARTPPPGALVSSSCFFFSLCSYVFVISSLCFLLHSCFFLSSSHNPSFFSFAISLCFFFYLSSSSSPFVISFSSSAFSFLLLLDLYLNCPSILSFSPTPDTGKNTPLYKHADTYFH